ncbi:hypothetical protein E4N94_01060 [Treponema denticola]|uniref:hypothetical protein n=1 Tax=Treponema denticola TaxID=158 RepID=UPI003D92A068
MVIRKNAKELFLQNNRFDLIFKYIYIKNKDKKTPFFKNLYLNHIKAFNNFYEEEPSDGVEKSTPEDFVLSFDALYNSIKEKGFDKSLGIIPIGTNGEISDGAHRLACACLLDTDVFIENDGRKDEYDYKFFLERGLDRKYADYAAIEYVKMQPNAYIVNLHSVISEEFDPDVENILKEYGNIYYKKSIALNYNGYVNLKKMSYGSFWQRESWIGDSSNSYLGAQSHAHESMGNGGNLRAYVFVCEQFDCLNEIKKRVRSLFNIGNYSIHINDYREEALALAQFFFNDNSIQIMNLRPFGFEDSDYDSYLMEFKNRITEEDLDINDFSIVGSSPLNILGIRKSADIDFLYSGTKKFNGEDENISSHDSELRYYPASKYDIIYNSSYYFYYEGFKILSLEALYSLKKKRNEKPKDIVDCKTIRKLLHKSDKLVNSKRSILILFTVLKKYIKKIIKYVLRIIK